MMDSSDSEDNGDKAEKSCNWVDISSDFKTAVTDLKMGELLHDDVFVLYEAMSAIPIMNPKMDGGMECNRGTRKVKSLSQSIEEGIVKYSNFDYRELIGIIDHTLACIVSWLDGYSLAETVFTNLYLHKPYNLEDKTMKAFSISVYKLIEIIKSFIDAAILYEEEDFQPEQYGYNLIPNVSELRIVGMLRDVEQDLNKKNRIEHLATIEAVHARIQFIRVFYQALILIGRTEQPPYLIVDCQKFLGTATDLLITMKASVNLGIQPDKDNFIPGFEPLINKKFLPPTFPRYTRITPRNEALDYLHGIVERLKAVIKIHSATSLHHVLEFFIGFSKTNPCLLSRSALQLVYLGSNYGDLRDIIQESIKSFISPPALVSEPILSNLQAKNSVESFLSHCTEPFVSFFQLCGHNRVRQRKKLAHLLEEFKILQDEANRLDAYIHTLADDSTARPPVPYFGTWILYHTLKIMIMYLLSGFELELYSRHEFYFIYWYLYKILYNWVISALSRADSLRMENELMNELDRSKTSSTEKPNHKSRPYNLYFQALKNMCGGYYKALKGFHLDGKITMPDPQLDSEKVRYEHRFAPFQELLTPPPVPYTKFKENTSDKRLHQPIASNSFYLSGCKHFYEAHQLLEKLHSDVEINNLLKISNANFVVLKLLVGGQNKDSNKRLEFDFSVNQYFPIIKLT